MMTFQNEWLDNVIYRMTAVVSYVGIYDAEVTTVANYVLQVVTKMKKDSWRKKKEEYKLLFKECDKKVAEIRGGFKHLFSETLTSYMRIVVYLNSDVADDADDANVADVAYGGKEDYELIFW